MYLFKRHDDPLKIAPKALITPRLIRIAVAIVLILWTGTVGIILYIDYRDECESVEHAATVLARSQFDKDVLYRRWNAQLGGVYARTSTGVQPNPYLEHIPDRDITTTDGDQLTLINPAYMTRQVHELGYNTDGVRGHITSLDPIRPENAPDEWERRALEQFDDPDDVVTSLETIDGLKVLRYMKPLVTEESCLACHAHQGYVLGDVRGGISVTVPMEEFVTIAKRQFRSDLLRYGMFWMLGIAVLIGGGRMLVRRAHAELEARDRIEALLAEKRILLDEVQHRIKNNMGMMASLIRLKAGNLTQESGRRELEATSIYFDAMMALYNKLYTASGTEDVPLGGYISDVVQRIREFVTTTMPVQFAIDLPDAIVPAKILTNLGILTTELVTNSIKHAFTGREKGTIAVRGKVVGDALRYSVSDDGIGMSDDTDLTSNDGFGGSLIVALSEQMHADIEIRSAPNTGTTVELTIPHIVPTTNDKV